MIFNGMYQYWASIYKGVDRKDVGVGWVVEKAKSKKEDNTNGRV